MWITLGMLTLRAYWGYIFTYWLDNSHVQNGVAGYNLASMCPHVWLFHGLVVGFMPLSCNSANWILWDISLVVTCTVKWLFKHFTDEEVDEATFIRLTETQILRLKPEMTIRTQTKLMDKQMVLKNVSDIGNNDLMQQFRYGLLRMGLNLQMFAKILHL